MHVVSFIGFKGGIGRTTSAAALSVGFATMGMRVAVIDAGFAVPLVERNRSTFDGLGSIPLEKRLRRTIEERSLALSAENQPFVRSVASTAHFEDVIEELRMAGCSHVVVDTPAHQVPVVFATALISSLLIVPLRHPVDVPCVRTSVEDDFVATSGSMRFMISNTLQSREIRHLLHPRAILDTELPHSLFQTVEDDGPIAGQAHVQNWQDSCVSLALEISKLLEDE